MKKCLGFTTVFLSMIGIAPGQNLFVSSAGTNSVIQYNGTTGALIGTFVTAASGGLSQPEGLTFGSDGNLYVSSQNTDSVLKYNGSTGAFSSAFVTTGSGGLSGPQGLTFGPDGNLYVSSFPNNSVLKYNGSTGIFVSALVGNGGGGLSGPSGLTFGPDGNLYVSSFSSNNVLKFNGTTGAFISAFVTAGSGGLSGPVGLTFGADTNLYVSSQLSANVLKYNGSTGAFISAFVPTGSGGLESPVGLRFGPDSNLYVGNQNNSTVLKYNGTTGAVVGTFVASASGGLSSPSYMAFFSSAGVPDLTISATHIGNVSQGQVGAAYWIIVTNSGTAATSGMVTVTDTVPAGLTPTAISSTGWTCTQPSGPCTRSDALAASTSYPAITLTVNVPPNAPGFMTNTATVSGGGETNTANDIANDGTTITVAATPDLSIRKTHVGNFTQGQTGATYTIMVTNAGTTATTGTTTVMDTLPAGLTFVSGTGGGFNCSAVAQIVTCNNANPIPIGTATITLIVTVATNAPANLTNSATVTNPNIAADPDDTAQDPTIIAPAQDGTYQLRHIANLSIGDSFVNLTNAGTLDGRAPAGNICVNVYTFDPAEELISCCACPITPNGLVSLSARNDLISNTLTPGVPTSITVKLVSSAVFGVGVAAGVNISASSCDASAVGSGVIGPPNTGNIITRGMRAWATTLHLNSSVFPAPGIYQQTETPFSVAELSPSELLKLTSFCGFIQAIGSGFGICRSCRFGSLGGELR